MSKDEAAKAIRDAPEAPAPGTAAPKANGAKAPRRTNRRRDERAQLLSGIDLWRSPDGIAHASVPIHGHREHMRVVSREFRTWIQIQFYLTNKVGLSGQAQADIVNQAEAQALSSGIVRRPWRRTACDNGKIYIDLGGGDPAGERRAVEIDEIGWRVVRKTDVPVEFLRGPDAQPLIEPFTADAAEARAKPEDLCKFVNLGNSTDNLALLWGWLLNALRPFEGDGAYPLLSLVGEHGTGKSIASRDLQSLVDPSSLTGRALPREERDLFITAMNRHLVAFDNLSKITELLADCLCRIATGGGFSARTLHTDADESMFTVTKPILLNSISSTILSRPDLADRALRIELQPLTKRREQAAMASDFNAMRAGLLGLLCTGLSSALLRLPETVLENPPRMIDAVRWAEAGAAGLGFDANRVAHAWAANRQEADREALAVDDVAQAVVTMVKAREESGVGPFKDSMTALYLELCTFVSDRVTTSPLWPRLANGLSGRLRRIAPLLRSIHAIEVTHGKGGADSERWTSVRRVGCSPVRSRE